MSQQITQTLLQNGSAIGLKLTGSIVNVVNNIDEELKRKADKDELTTIQAEVQLKPSIEDVANLMKTVTDRYDDVVATVKQSVYDNASKPECANFPLSDPPTLEEITEINKMEPGSFYTLNGGNVIMIFRQQVELPPA